MYNLLTLHFKSKIDVNFIILGGKSLSDENVKYFNVKIFKAHSSHFHTRVWKI